MQLETDGGRVELLRNKGDLYRRDSSQNDWPSYGGQSGGNRYSVVVGGIPNGNIRRASTRAK
jgi:hypothetical protein